MVIGLQLAGAVLAATALSFVASEASAWERIVHEDRISGYRLVWFSVDAKSEFQCNVGTSSAKLVLGCDQGKARAILGTSNCLFPEEELARYRTEISGLQIVWMSPQSSGSAANLGGVVDKRDASILLKHVLTSDELIMQISPIGIASADLDFDVAGLAAAAGNDMSACFR